MLSEPRRKYQPFPPINLPDRQWPSKTIERAPTWVSVDLRDGNQALIEPMNVSEKLELFDLLVHLGFKEIEIGFPAAAQVEFDFVRTLIEKKLIPSDVWVQVLTQAREHLIHRTFEALEGAENVIVHLYNSTSAVQRRVVFGLGQDEIAGLAVEGTKLVKKLAGERKGGNLRFEYSPESFTGTELDFAKRICENVMDVWQPTTEEKIILNLPSTVELATPNVYADQIEWMCRNLADRDKAIISVHTHNDRGTAVAAAELAQMAGAERVEGTLFGYGERTGNVDVVTLALNLYSQGVNPNLDFSKLDEVSRTLTKCTDNPIHQRHPYAGELVFTAFSGSHQDAISKGMKTWNADPSQVWDVPYIPIDPKDMGRDYTTIIRVNSQSGKGGVSYLLRAEAGFDLPRLMQPEFGQVVQQLAETTGKEIAPEQIETAFRNEYLDRSEPFALLSHEEEQIGDHVTCHAVIRKCGKEQALVGRGNGPIAAFVDGLKTIAPVEVLAFQEHSLGHGAEAKAAAYCQLRFEGKTGWGAGVHESTATASFLSVLSALNRLSN